MGKMDKFVRTNGSWSIHKTVELNNKRVISTHILHDRSILVTFLKSFSFYNQEMEHITAIELYDLLDELITIKSFSHMAHGKENEFGLVVSVNKVDELRSKGIKSEIIGQGNGFD